MEFDCDRTALWPIDDPAAAVAPSPLFFSGITENSCTVINLIIHIKQKDFYYYLLQSTTSNSLMQEHATKLIHLHQLLIHQIQPYLNYVLYQLVMILTFLLSNALLQIDEFLA